MRSSKPETKDFFGSRNIAFHDSTLRIGDNNIHYIQTGQDNAPTLVFIHGSPGSWDAWKSYLSDPQLLQRYRLIAPDRPGFGFSDYRESMALAPQAKLLNQLIERLDNGQPLTLIGHSYGGPLIVKMSLEAPQQYQNLMILAGALDPEAEQPEKWRRLLMRFPLKYLVPGSFKPSNEELWLLKEDLILLRDELHELRPKVMIVHGTADKLVPFENVSFMEKTFTGVDDLKIMPLEDERHFIVWDREALIKRTLMDSIH